MRSHPAIAAIVLALLLSGAGLLATAAGSPTRQMLDAQLRAALPAPATAQPDSAAVAARTRRAGGVAVSTRRGVAVWRSGPYRVSVRLTPNLPAAHNRLIVTVLRDGRPMPGAVVAVSFSMPVMDMWSGLRSTLRTGSIGRGTVTLPVLGMPGVWQLHVAVDARGGRPVALASADVSDALVN